MKTSLKFFEEQNDGGGSSQGADVFDKPAKDGMGAGPAKPDVGDENELKPAPTTVDAKALAQEFGAILGERFKPAEPTAKTVEELTPEEREKLLNVWKPSKEWIAKFGNLETQESALAELRDGFIKHGDTITQYRLRELQSALEAKYEPVLKFMQEEQNRRVEERFAKKYEQLSDPALKPLIDSVTEGLAKAEKKFESEEKLFEAIATGVESVIKVSNPDFKLTAGSSPATKTKGQPSGGIPVTTPGAGGGTAAKTDTKSDKPRGIQVFE